MSHLEKKATSCSSFFVFFYSYVEERKGDKLFVLLCFRRCFRVQDSPRVSRAMGTLLSRVQERTAGWVGSSVVHLGDHNVPNALMFIDKYTQVRLIRGRSRLTRLLFFHRETKASSVCVSAQVPRILNPLVLCIEKLGEVYENPSLKNYIDSSFGGLYKLR